MRIERDDPFRDDVLALLGEHLADMRATSPPESVHALDPAALTAPSITFWTVREDGVLLGCGALKDLGGGGGEIKSSCERQDSAGTGASASRRVRRSSSSPPGGSTCGTVLSPADRSATTRSTRTAST